MEDKDIIVKIKSGDKDLIASGSFITHSGNEIQMEIGNKEAPLLLIFEFVKDIENKEVRKATEARDQKTLVIKFFNYDDTRFTTTPWFIGNIYQRKLYIVYHIEPLHSTDMRNITYTFYLGEEANNG
ncbi:MAG: hypothetical protein V4549_12710 [Bacteroidota bacterium]